jgi:hypothetical protein
MTYLYEAIQPTRLYIKQCPHCGLKYFGKSISDDIETYPGSGTRWARHLNKHNVEPIHLWNSNWYYDTSISRFALKFSRINKIVESNKWANLKEENGLDGGWEYLNNSGLNLYGMNGKTPNVSDNLKRGRETVKWKLANDLEWSRQFKLKRSISIKNWLKENDNPFKGKTHSDKTKKIISEKSKLHQSGSGNSQFGKIWIYSTEQKICKKIFKNEPIPEGWNKGRRMKFD